VDSKGGGTVALRDTWGRANALSLTDSKLSCLKMVGTYFGRYVGGRGFESPVGSATDIN